jgi:hypothetical protein
MIPLLNALAIKKNDKEGSPIQNTIALLLLAGGGYLLYRQIKKELADKFQEEKNEKLFEKEKDPNVKLTYKPSQYVTFADKIEDAIIGTTFNTTDEEAIYKVMYYLKSNNDWLELNKAYGIRKWQNMTNPFDFYGTDKNMVASLQADLDTAEKSKVNKILKSNGITYRI